jgi:mono/diheme cytochrome c family protein
VLHKYCVNVPGLVAGAVLAATALAAPAAAEEAESPPYDGHIQCETEGDPSTCQIDLWLTRGYRAFSQCQVCHGLTGDGSTIGPSLVRKLRDIDLDRFLEVVVNGYEGQIGVMPGWGTNPNVMNYIDQLYAYLLARADGVLPPGRLKRYDR